MSSNDEVLARTAARAENTWVFDHPDGHCIVLAHPGQPKPPTDPKFLRENFGIMPAHTHLVRRLSESPHRPLTEAEKAVERAGNRQSRIDELKAELSRLMAAEGVEADRAASEDLDGEGDGDGEHPAVAPAGRAAKSRSAAE
jgi:hypothetical protein